MTDIDIIRERIMVPGPPGVSGAAGTAGSDFPWRTFRRYGPTAHARGSVAPTSVSAVMATVANKHARYAPFYVTNNCTISEVKIAVAAAAAGGLINVSIYTASIPLTPSTLLRDFGNVTATVAEEKVITPTTTLQLTGETWYIAVLIGEATAEGLQIAGRQTQTGIFGVDASGFAVSGRVNLTTTTSLVPPATWAYPTAELSTFIPRFDLYVVSVP